MNELGDPSKPRTAFSADKTIGKEEWLTPPGIIRALGPFDLDPCAPPQHRRPWNMAAEHFTVEDNGLVKPWHGRVWCNPPYGNEAGKFLAKLADHGNGIALVFARTETRMFHESVWGKASGLLFFLGRLSFCDFRGKPIGVAGAPSVLIAYGSDNAKRLASSGFAGALVSGHGIERIGHTAQSMPDLFGSLEDAA